MISAGVSLGAPRPVIPLASYLRGGPLKCSRNASSRQAELAGMDLIHRGEPRVSCLRNVAAGSSSRSRSAAVSCLSHKPVPEPCAVGLDEPRRRMWKMDRQNIFAGPGDLGEKLSPR